MFPLPLRSRCFGASLLLLAVWVQTLAPALTLRAQGLAADPLGRAVICGRVDGKAEADRLAQAPAPVMPGCGQCEICCLGSATPALPAVSQIGRSLRWIIVSWPIPPPPECAGPMRPFSGQPRAPPALA